MKSGTGCGFAAGLEMADTVTRPEGAFGSAKRRADVDSDRLEAWRSSETIEVDVAMIVSPQQ
jgi:hypothetical protein